jgi:alpha-tubulin suppressor-like RCC1 family protein
LHTALLTKSGYIYCTGDNKYGQLGIGTNINVDKFTKCQRINEIQGKIKAISCGRYHTALLTKSGYIYATGWNEYGQLGIEAYDDVDIFTLCTDVDKIQGKIKAISCGGLHTALLTKDGYIYATGANGNGRLGIPNHINKIDIFTLCTDFDNRQGHIKAISCGDQHTALLTIFGYIYCTGNNNFGQLGIPKNEILHVDKFTLCTNFDNKQGKIKSISCGSFHTALLTKIGQIYTTGNNNFGQLGIPKNQTPNGYVDIFTLCYGGDVDKIQGHIKTISCGYRHTALLTIYGYIYTTGDNEYGQLGIPKSDTPLNYLDTFTSIVLKDFPPVERGSTPLLPKNINNKFSWISDGCTANSVFAYKDIISNKKNCDKIWCNLDFSC